MCRRVSKKYTSDNYKERSAKVLRDCELLARNRYNMSYNLLCDKQKNAIYVQVGLQNY